MSAEITRKTVIAIVEEVTPGTPVAPSSGADYIAVRDGFDVEFGVEELENDEIVDSIAKKAPILGKENPSMELPFYLRHSGTEAVEPNSKKLLKNAFGAVVAAGTERDTVAGSTAGTSSVAAALNVDTGEGVEFERGEAVLIKDGTNGYGIRNVQSIATDALTLGFNLAVAPAAGVNLGRAILYKPFDTPPGLSGWVYRGNGADIELPSGLKVSELSIEAVAGEILSGSFSLEGVKSYFDPIIILAADRFIDFDDGSVKAASVTAKIYKHPHELASALQTAMNSVSSGITVIYNDFGANKGKFTIAKASGTLELLWNTGTNAANTIGDKIGFSTAADDTGFLTYTSDNAQSWVSPYTPTADANVNPLVVKNNEVMIGDFDDYGCANVQSFTFNLSKEHIDVPDICEESGVIEKLATSREVSCEMVITLQRHDADKFRRFSEGSDIRFAYNGGVKSGGNWVPGRCVNIYIPTAKISALKVADGDGVVTFEMTLTATVGADLLGEVYLNLL